MVSLSSTVLVLESV
uniref:Uncharacterized protein n=1 Tax=Anguilla anguilla TaxID=7936 RepID=A0A0E9QE12_ANGAN